MLKQDSLKNRLKWFVFVIPSLTVYFIFFILPAGESVFYSLTDWNGLTSNFVGFENFIKLFQDERVMMAFKNTLLFASVITIVQNGLGLLLAVILNMKLTIAKQLRTIFFMPAVFAPLVVGYVWKYMLEPNFGVLNQLLGKIGLSSMKMDWLGDPKLALWMIIIFTVWQYTGYSMVIFFAGLQSIPCDLMEAADIDGATSIHKFIHVTFPLIAPAFTLNIILTTISTLKLFDPIYVMTGGGPGYFTNSVATLIYAVGFSGSQRWGYGAAMSVVLFIFISTVSGFMVKKLREREVSY